MSIRSNTVGVLLAGFSISSGFRVDPEHEASQNARLLLLIATLQL